MKGEAGEPGYDGRPGEEGDCGPEGVFGRGTGQPGPHGKQGTTPVQFNFSTTNFEQVQPGTTRKIFLLHGMMLTKKC